MTKQVINISQIKLNLCVSVLIACLLRANFSGGGLGHFCVKYFHNASKNCSCNQTK